MVPAAALCHKPQTGLAGVSAQPVPSRFQAAFSRGYPGFSDLADPIRRGASRGAVQACIAPLVWINLAPDQYPKSVTRAEQPAVSGIGCQA